MGGQQSSASGGGGGGGAVAKTCYYELLEVDQAASSDEWVHMSRRVARPLAVLTPSQDSEGIPKKGSRAPSRQEHNRCRECDATVRPGADCLRCPVRPAGACLVRLTPRCYPAEPRGGWLKPGSVLFPQRSGYVRRRHKLPCRPLQCDRALHGRADRFLRQSEGDVRPARRRGDRARWSWRQGSRVVSGLRRLDFWLWRRRQTVLQRVGRLLHAEDLLLEG